MKLFKQSISGLALLTVGVSLSTACKREEEAKAPPPPVVLTAPAATRDVPVYREWVGTLDGSENSEIRARVTGYLMKRDYQEGSLVKKGDLLFEIDQRPFEAALAEAKSQLAQARASQLATQATYERNRQLFEKKVISEQEYTNTTQINESNIAKIKAIEANVEQSQLNLDFCSVRSPVNGIAGIAQAQVGDLVGTANSLVLTTVSTLDPIKILFPISESDYLFSGERVQDTLSKPFDQRRDSIELILADGSTFPQKGRLLSVDRQVKASTGTILVTALVQNPGSVLRPGFFARARITASVLKDAIVVPQRAVSEVQGSYQIGIIGSDGKAEIRPVKVGVRSGTDWVIASGLKAGEKVVIEGLQKIRAGMPVEAKPWTPPAPPSPQAAAEADPAAKH